MLPFFLVGLVTTWRKKRDVAVLMLCLIVVPFLTTLFLEFLHAIDFRYFLFLLPTYLLLVAEGFVVTAASLERAVGVRRQRKDPAEADRIQRRSLMGPVTLLVLLLVTLLTYARPLTMVYAQAKINDWRAIAGYLANKVQPGDVVLVERWGVEALRYYLPPTSDATVLALNPERWQRMRFLGVRTWLVGLGDEYEQQARDSFQKIGDSEWQDTRWVYGRSQQDDFYYPVTESAANIYVDAETVSSPFVDFIDISNADWTQETYRDMAPGRQTTVPLTLEAAAPRVLKVRYFDYPGKDFEVSVDGQLIGSVMGGSLGGWQTWQSHLPESAGDSVRVATTAIGQEHVSLDWLELAYALPPASTVADYDLPIDQILDDQGAIDFDEVTEAQVDNRNLPAPGSGRRDPDLAKCF